ncbi:MAG: hypothetical protein HYY32_01600 [Chloroflexi bacterium]|nr:hypothetical protein [Chloroflexota bacterium]
MTTSGDIAAGWVTSPPTSPAGGCSSLHKDTPNLKRRLMHGGASLAVPVLSFFVPGPTLVAVAWAITATLGILEIARFASPRVNRLFIRAFGLVMRPAEKSSMVAASTYVALSTAIAFTVLPHAVAVTAECFLALGDAAAGAVGERWGKTRAFGKSVEGTAAFLVAAGVAALVLSATPGRLPIPTVAAGGIVAALTEILPLPLDDNVSVPLISGVAMALTGAVLSSF